MNKISVVSQAAAEVLVEARGIGVHRAGRWLIRDVDLTIRRGEIVTLIGPNGSGKSTTARTTLGIVKPDAGTIQRRQGLTVGYVPQRLSIDRTLPLTVERLMTLTARLTPAEVQATLQWVDIGHLAKAEVQLLSGGEFQRVMLARALARKPDLLVLDEPVQGVDFTGEVALYDLIRRIRDETGCSILLISHDLHIVMAQTDTVICLNGHVCCHGTPQSVSQNPEYVRLFGRQAAETLAIYRHHHDHVHGADGHIADQDHDHDHSGHDHSGHDNA